MKETLHWTVTWLLAALLLAGPAAADSFRCGNKLVTDGDSADKVRALCGEPTDIKRNVTLQRPVIWRDGRPYYVSEDMVEVTVEYWTYNLGPNKLMRRLRIDGGIVTEIETLGPGYNEPDP